MKDGNVRKVLREERILFAIVLLAFFVSGGFCQAVERDEAESIAWRYCNLRWRCRKTFYVSLTGFTFRSGRWYTGEAYWYGGNDDTDRFLRKIRSGKRPRKEAGIDCSAFVSRCWRVSRHTTRSLPGISKRIGWNDLKKGDILNKPGTHVMLYHKRSHNGSYIVWEASGSANRCLHQVRTASYCWRYYEPRRYRHMQESSTPADTNSGNATGSGSASSAPGITGGNVLGITDRISGLSGRAPLRRTSSAIGGTRAGGGNTGYSSRFTSRVFRVTASALNVRRGPGISHGRIGLVYRNQLYFAREVSKGWYRIFFRGRTGWCYGGYLTPVRGATVARVTASTLNVRNGPGINHRDIGNVHNAQRYVILSRRGSWYRVYWDGSSDWISARYAIPERY